MKKFLISIVLTLWILSQNTQIFAYQEISPENFSQFLQWIWENKDFKKTILRKDVWKISLEMAGFSPKNKDTLSYIREISNKKILWESLPNPNLPAKKYETLQFLFKLFWVNTPFFNDQIMNFADVQNGDPVVSKCLELRICEWKNSKIFWKNSPITRLEFYQYLVKTYSVVYWQNWENISENNFSDLSDSDKKFEILKNIYETVKTEYYKAKNLDKDELIYWAAKGMADAVWDKYTKFFPPAKTQQFKQVLDWNFVWIGAYVEHDVDWVKIISPMSWSPAKKAWLKAWDVILEADWKILKKYSLQKAVNFIKWKIWTIVNLKVKRWNSILNFSIKRWKVLIPSVESKILEKDILYIKINQFWERTDKELFEILRENDNLSKIIFDLRNNPWWYLEVAKNILSMFVDAWKAIVRIKYPDFEISSYSSSKVHKFKNKKIAILVNWWTASASEIFAWTMQDYWFAKVIWETTYWKWTVQNLIDFYDWSQFKLTIANWKTWKWSLIEGEWVEPDLVVHEDWDRFWDEVLKAGVRSLR